MNMCIDILYKANIPVSLDKLCVTLKGHCDLKMSFQGQRSNSHMRVTLYAKVFLRETHWCSRRAYNLLHIIIVEVECCTLQVIVR